MAQEENAPAADDIRAAWTHWIAQASDDDIMVFHFNAIRILEEKYDAPRTLTSMDLDDSDPSTTNSAPIDETFNVGDRIEVKKSIGDSYQKGERGTVVGNLGPYVEVKLDEPRYAIVEGVKVEAQSTSFEPHELAHIDDETPSLEFRKPGTTPSA
jgi:hypothetical protein